MEMLLPGLDLKIFPRHISTLFPSPKTRAAGVPETGFHRAAEASTSGPQSSDSLAQRPSSHLEGFCKHR